MFEHVQVVNIEPTDQFIKKSTTAKKTKINKKNLIKMKKKKFLIMSI